MQENSQLPSNIVGLMAKYWEPGRVKTRLGASIGMDRSANLHQLFVHQLLCELGKSETGQGRADESEPWTLQWVASPPESIDLCSQQMADWGLQSVKVTDQVDGDLGDRMWRWLTNFNQPSEGEITKAILIGSDCPLLSCGDITDALQQLDQFDVVLGPAVDGGYYLIGFQCPVDPKARAIFTDMVWSREDVFEVTRQRLNEIGMTVSVLPTLEDVDTESELKRLRQSLSEQPLKGVESIDRLRGKIDDVMESTDEA